MAKQFNQNFRVGQGGILVVTADQNIPLGDQPKLILVDATAGPVNVTLFAGVGLGGKQLQIKKIDSSANAVTITPASGETIDGAATQSLLAENDAIDIVSDNENWLRTGGGGNGGGISAIDLFAQTELLDDFYYADPGASNFLGSSKYLTVNGTGSSATLDQPQSGVLFGGTVFLEVNVTLSGQGSAFRNVDRNSSGGHFDSNKAAVMRIRVALVNDNTLRVDGMGLIDDNFSIFGGVTGVSNFDNSVDEGYYFKKEAGGNWIAVSQDSNAATETDTGVANVLDVFQDFEIIHTPGVSDVFKIDGVTVVTHTTTIADSGVRLFLSHAIAVLSAGTDRAIEIDLWHVVVDR